MRSRWWCVLVAVLTLNFAFVLANDRQEEMEEMIEERLEEGDERDAFLEAVEEYIEERNEALSDLVDLIAQSGEGEQEGAWQSIVSDLMDLPGLADADDDLESSEALYLYDEFMEQEEEWVSALSVLETAAYRDDMVAMRIRLVNMTQLLETKWQGFLNDDGAIDEKQYKALADIYGILAQLAGQSDGKRKAVRDSIQVVVELLRRFDVIPGSVPGEVASAITQAIGVIAETVKVYNPYATAVEALRPQIRELAGQELGLLVLFNETREDTQLFVEQNGYDVMKELFDGAVDELERFEGVGTDGQRDDASVVVEALVGVLEDRLAEGGNVFNEFVAKHNLKFFGPVGPDIREFLVDTKAWLEDAERVDDLDLEDVLSAWRSDANSFFGVSLSVDGITDYERQFIQEQLRNDLDALRKEIDEAGAAFSTENLMLIHDRREIEEAIE
ncbi:MAG: hypothetical protein R6W77_10375 [Trueperaceae bacterium]